MNKNNRRQRKLKKKEKKRNNQKKNLNILSIKIALCDKTLKFG